MFYILSTTHIMWKEIGIVFFGIFFLQLIIAKYIVKSYKEIIKMFYECTNQDSLKKKAKKILNMIKRLFVKPWHKRTYLMFNNLCLVLASLAFIEKNEDEFMYYLNRIERENEFEMKAFVLSLYFRSKNQNGLANRWYKYYFNCVHEDSKLYFVLKVIFEAEEKNIEFYNAVKQFKNPAILQLFEDNGIEISNV